MSTIAAPTADRVFPWLKYLTAEQTDEFYADFFSALERALQTRDWSILEDTIVQWQATAELLADPALTMLLTANPSADEVEDWDDVESELFDPSA